MRVNNCAILVLSCDKNENLLNIFFDKFNKMWSDCDYPIFLGMEKKVVEYEGVKVLNSDKNSFSGRILDYLGFVDADYVLIMLDDFIIEKAVDTSLVHQYEELISKDPHIATITLAWIAGTVIDEYSPKVKTKKWNSDYLVNLQIGFWNKKVLRQLIKDGESAWQVELYGTIRARRMREYAFLHLESDDMMPIVYNRGWLMVKGAWNGNEIIRLNLENYAADFLNGMDIKYHDLGKMKKQDVIKIRIGVILREALSSFGVYI